MRLRDRMRFRPAFQLILQFLIFTGPNRESDHEKFFAFAKPMHDPVGEASTAFHSVTQPLSYSSDSGMLATNAAGGTVTPVVVGSGVTPGWVLRSYWSLEHVPYLAVKFPQPLPVHPANPSPPSRPIKITAPNSSGTRGRQKDVSAGRSGPTGTLPNSAVPEYNDPTLMSSRASKNEIREIEDNSHGLISKDSLSPPKNQISSQESASPSSSRGEAKIREAEPLKETVPSATSQVPVPSMPDVYATSSRRENIKKKSYASLLQNVDGSKNIKPVLVQLLNPKTNSDPYKKKIPVTHDEDRFVTNDQEWKTVARRKGGQTKTKNFNKSNNVQAPSEELESVDEPTAQHESVNYNDLENYNRNYPQDQDGEIEASYQHEQSSEKGIDYSEPYYSNQEDQRTFTEEVGPQNQQTTSDLIALARKKQADRKKTQKKKTSKGKNGKNHLGKNSRDQLLQSQGSEDWDATINKFLEESKQENAAIPSKPMKESSSNSQNLVHLLNMELGTTINVDLLDGMFLVGLQDVFGNVKVLDSPSQPKSKLTLKKQANMQFYKKRAPIYWEDQGEHLLAKYFLAQHLKLYDPTPYLGLEEIDLQLVNRLVNVHFQTRGSVWETFMSMKTYLDSYEAFRRLFILSRQLFQFFKTRALGTKEKISSAMKRYPLPQVQVVSEDYYGNKLCTMDMKGLTLPQLSEIGRMAESFLGYKEWMRRGPPTIHFFAPEFVNLVRASNWRRIAEHQELHLAAQSNGLNVNKVLSIVFILGLENEAWLESKEDYEVHYMAKLLHQILTINFVDPVLPWYETVERRWLVHHYQDEFLVKFNAFILRLARAQTSPDQVRAIDYCRPIPVDQMSVQELSRCLKSFSF